MIRINLLPHRAERRRRRLIQFVSLSVVSLILAVVLVGLGHGFMSARIFYQDRRNDFLKSEISKLDKQIEELKRLREETKKLLARKEVVENLQSTRSDVVHLLDQMLRILPDGVYLKSLKQSGNKISITGNAQSNARVSTLMRAIENSPWLDSPTLIEVHSAASGQERTNEFSMTFNLTKQNSPSVAVAATKPAAASAPVAVSAPVAAAPPEKKG
jgi:type IV pilus assembly protein PilN